MQVLGISLFWLTMRPVWLIAIQRQIHLVLPAGSEERWSIILVLTVQTATI